MKIIDAILAAYREFRSSLENPQTPLSYPAEWLLDIFNGGRTDSGIRVSELTALQTTTVFACVQTIASAVGGLDLNVFERLITGDRTGKRIAYDHDLFDLLDTEPNPEMTSFTFRKTLQAHALLWGNFYAEIQRDKGNRIVAIWPRNPSRTKPRRASAKVLVAGEVVQPGELFYATTEGASDVDFDPEGKHDAGIERLISAKDMLHVPGLSLDGRLGQDVIWLSRQAVGLALATEKFGAKFFGNGARPGGVITYPGTLTQEQREALKRSWTEAQGGENAHRTALLDNGMTFTATAVTPNEGQFLETRKFQRVEICSVFGVPPHMIGDTDKTNRANTEQVGLEFVNFCLWPWLKSWQQELKRKLFPRVGRNSNRYFAMFDTAPLTMPDAASRMAFNNAGKQWGWLSTNDVRQREHLNPLDDPDADALWMPLNMQKLGADAPTAAAGQVDEPGTRALDKIGERYARAYWRLFRDGFGRITTRKKTDSADFRRVFLPIFLTIGDDLYRLAADEAGVEVDPEALENSRFVLDYVDAMEKRADAWRKANGNGDEVARGELTRAVRALSIEIFRTVATARARQLTEPTTEVTQ